jgi:hypothetical protein
VRLRPLGRRAIRFGRDGSTARAHPRTLSHASASAHAHTPAYESPSLSAPPPPPPPPTTTHTASTFPTSTPRPQEEEGRHARYKRYRSIPQAPAMGSRACGGRDKGGGGATATILWRDSAAQGGEAQPLRRWEGLQGALAAVSGGGSLPVMELPTSAPQAAGGARQAGARRAEGALPDMPAAAAAEQPGEPITPDAGGPGALETPGPASAAGLSERIPDRAGYEGDMALLRSLFGGAQQRVAEDPGPAAEPAPSTFLRAQSDPASVWPAESAVTGDLGFMRTASGGRVVGSGSGADATLVRSLWEAYVWHATETSSMLQSLLEQVDWAMKRCSSASVMFTRWFHSISFISTYVFSTEELQIEFDS